MSQPTTLPTPSSETRRAPVPPPALKKPLLHRMQQVKAKVARERARRLSWRKPQQLKKSCK